MDVPEYGQDPMVDLHPLPAKFEILPEGICGHHVKAKGIYPMSIYYLLGLDNIPE
jgi:hypothetical protein